MRMRNPALAITAAALAVLAAGCQELPEEEHAVDRTREPVPLTKVVTETDARAQPDGDPVAVEAASDDNLQWAASVAKIHSMEDQGAKVFAVSGGDPAVNGLVTYLGLFDGPAEGWSLYPLGDFEDWTVSETARRRFVLNVRESGAGEAGDIVTRERRLIVEFRRGDTPASHSVTLTPAR